MQKLLSLCTIILCAFTAFGQPQLFDVKGTVISQNSGRPIPYATVIVEGAENFGASADSLGRFEIFGLPPSIYRFAAYSLGAEPALSAEYIVGRNTSPIVIEMVDDPRQLDSVVVTRSLFSRIAQSPVSMHQIGLQMLERTAGANRDLAKVVQNFPGVAFSPAAYRNDLIVRGGSPSENSFYVDGFPLPNINHFSTQGASGGPVGLINADLIRQIDLYSGAFPIWSNGALSSVLDIRLREGDPDQQKFKTTLGASEAGLSGSGHFSDKATYIFSARRSYLQLLFAALGLPFLPDYIDTQFKSTVRLSERDRLSFLFVGALDDMSLNEAAESPSARYILSYLPQIEQNTLSAGVSYRHFDGSNSYALYLSHSAMGNKNLKYRNNDTSAPDNLTLRLTSREQSTSLRSENRSYLSPWTLRYGAEAGYNHYSVDSFTPKNQYETSLGFALWGLYGSGEYLDPDDRFSGSIGLRADGASYSRLTAQFWRYLSPRGALSLNLSETMTLNISSGIYFQLPEFTSLSYVSPEGERVNSHLTYSHVWESTIGVDLQPRQTFKLSLEGFYKNYGNLLLSLANGVPLSDKGTDFGAVGNEAVSQSVDGRAYGVEIMSRWQLPPRLSAIASLTLFRSEYKSGAAGAYNPSAWDNGFILNASAAYNLPRDWSVAAKIGAIGGAPYTPYDIEFSSLVEVWDVTGRAQYDYARHNALRSDAYCQVDLRVDKSYYFKKWSVELYLDIQNSTVSKFRTADIPVATSEVINPSAPAAEQQYAMEYIESVSGTLLPTIGISVEF